MFGNALQGWHIIVIVLVVLLLFGAPKLPGLARSIGQSMRIFRSEVKTMKNDDTTEDEPDEAVSEADTEAPTSKSTPKSSTKKPTSKP
jgi:sec-independent protein translocase protein TatA